MDWVDRPKNFKGLYGILQLLHGSHLDNFPQKTLKLGRVAFQIAPKIESLYGLGRQATKL